LLHFAFCFSSFSVHPPFISLPWRAGQSSLPSVARSLTSQFFFRIGRGFQAAAE
jgi:hypothetical protein